MVEIKNIDYVDLILRIIFAIFAAVAIYWLILKIMGKSPTLSEINLVLIVMLITATLNFYYKFGRFEGKIGGFIYNTKESFLRIKDDINEIKNRIK